MKVICPKCQFENQADTTRVVCARCATIIEVRLDRGPGLDINGRNPASRLPFSAGTERESFLKGDPVDSSSNRPDDVYATRIGDEFDDVLDIPRPSQTSYETNYEPSPVFDDIFTTPSYDSSDSYQYSASQNSSTTPIDFNFGGAQQRETQDHDQSPEPEFMGWPVLPENAIDEDEHGKGFTAARGGLLARVVLGAVVFGGLVFGAYYFLGDLISKRKDQAGNLIAGSTRPAGPQDSRAASAIAGDKSQSSTAATATGNATSASGAAGTTTNPEAVTRKPVDTGNQAAPTGTADNRSSGKPVDIPPMTGRAGHSDATKPVATVTVPNNGDLTIQIASYNSQSQANERVAGLKSAGIDARVVRAEIPGKGTWFRIQIGAYRSREEASGFANQLRSKGVIQEFIVTTIGK